MRFAGYTAFCSLGLVLLAPSVASAQSLIFDNWLVSDVGQIQSLRAAGSSPLARVTVGASNVTINNIAVDVDLSGDGNIKFLIFNAAGSSLYTSAPKAFTDTGRQWAMSDAFSDFTLSAGATYFIGGIADVGGQWGLDGTGNSQSGLSTGASNGNASNYATPTKTTNGSADSHVRLFQTTSAAIPEPGSLALLGLGLTGLGAGCRRFRRA